MPLYHERPTSKSRGGITLWWFGAPIIALVYTLMTPKYLPDIVPTSVGAVRWLVGLLVGVAMLAVLQLAHWILSRARQRGRKWFGRRRVRNGCGTNDRA